MNDILRCQIANADHGSRGRSREVESRSRSRDRRRFVADGSNSYHLGSRPCRSMRRPRWNKNTGDRGAPARKTQDYSVPDRCRPQEHRGGREILPQAFPARAKPRAPALRPMPTEFRRLISICRPSSRRRRISPSRPSAPRMGGVPVRWCRRVSSSRPRTLRSRGITPRNLWWMIKPRAPRSITLPTAATLRSTSRRTRPASALSRPEPLCPLIWAIAPCYLR